MQPPPKSPNEQIAELRALIERLKAELAELERLNKKATQIMADLEKPPKGKRS